MCNDYVEDAAWNIIEKYKYWLQFQMISSQSYQSWPLL